MSDIEITKFIKSGGILSKRISLARSGKVRADGSECRMSEGIARRILLNGVESLAALISKMRSNEALALGRLRPGLPDKVDVVLKRDLNDSTPADTIARTSDYLGYAPGQPAYLLLDHDGKGMPTEISAKLKATSGFWRAIAATIPALAGAGRVYRRSTSAGLYRRDTDKRVGGSASAHVYIPVCDGSDIERALKALHERLWLGGFGYFVVGAAGQLLDRSIVDAAVYGPERLVFEGAPEIIPPLAQDAKERRPWVRDGAMVDTVREIPPLTEAEASRVAEMKAEAKRRLEPVAAAARLGWAKKFAARRGLSAKEAERIAAQATTKHLLAAEFELVFDNLGDCTVADLLADPDKYVGEALADPLEGPGYGTGKAKVFRRSDGELMINSFAHGGIKYRLVDQDTALPIIAVVDGQIARVVDETEGALLAAGLNILVRGGGLVEPRERNRQAADGRKTAPTLLVPVTQERMAYLLNKYTVQFECHDRRSDSWRAINPPADVVKTLLALGEWQFPEVIGVVGAPTLRPDGSILSKHGYDAATRLWCDSTIQLPTTPERLTRLQADTALRLYTDLLSGFPFLNEVDRAVALAAIMTAVLRGGYALAPMFLVVAHDVGTGKSYLVDLIASIITGRWCPVISPGKDNEETEKRLGAILLEGGAVVSLDNLSFDLESDLLCQILTQPTVKTRILGQSAVPECEWRGTLFATGNNVRVVGDLVRRTLICNLDARCERPELREFAFDPIARVLENRAAYIAAAITIVRAYRMSEENITCPPLGGYEAWSRTVREPLIWLDEEDPIKSMDAARIADPERAAAQELIGRWKTVIGVDKPVSVREIIGTANSTKDNSDRRRYPKFRALLIERVGTGRGDEIDPKRLGMWLQQQQGRVYGRLRIDVRPHKGRGNDYVLREAG